MLMKFRWDEALRVFHPDSCTKIRAALDRHQELRNQLEFLLNTQGSRIPGANSKGLPDVDWWKGKLRNHGALNSIITEMNSSIQRLVSEPIPLGPDENAYAQMVKLELSKQTEQVRRINLIKTGQLSA